MVLVFDVIKKEPNHVFGSRSRIIFLSMIMREVAFLCVYVNVYVYFFHFLPSGGEVC